MSKYPDWLEDRFGDDIPEWAEFAGVMMKTMTKTEIEIKNI